MEIDGDDAPSTAGREELSRAGVLQVHELLRTAKGLLDAHAVGVVPSKQEPKQEPQPEESAAPAAQQQQGAAPDGTDTAAKLHALQQQYQAVVAGLRRTLQQCKELEESEASSRSAAAASTEEEAALEARCEQLRKGLEEKNQLIKMLIDRLRHLLDAMNMWDTHDRRLQQQAKQQHQ